MIELVLKNSASIDSAVFNDITIERLIIQDSTLEIPSTIGQLKNLKELTLTNNTLGHLPVELFDLQNTFIFLEKNKPEETQLVSLLLFDLQWNKITKPQAILFLHILQKNSKDISKADLPHLIAALNYHIEPIRESALRILSSFLNWQEPQAEQATVAIIGKPFSFTLADIAHRMEALSIKIESKITKNTTHVVICEQPATTHKSIEKYQKTTTTESQFMAWLNASHKLLLGEKTDENADAIQNVSEMLLSSDTEHVSLALTMMKSHGASPELLTSLYILLFSTSDSGIKRKAKTLFRKNAPEALLEYVSEGGKKGSINEWQPRNRAIYDFLDENPYMDRYKIALHLNKSLLIELGKDEAHRTQLLREFLNDDVLDISTLSYIPEETKNIDGLKVIRGYYYNQFSSLPDWLPDLTIESLDLYKQQVDLPDSFAQFKTLKHFCLPTRLDTFPKVIAELHQLESLEMSAEQFYDLPASITNLTALNAVTIYVDWFDEVNKNKVAAITKLLPANCTITHKQGRSRS